MNDTISNLPDVSFIDDITLQSVLDELVSNYCYEYKRLTGEDIVLADSDPYRILMMSTALMLYQGYEYIERAGKMNLLKYSFGSYLEHLAAGRGLERKQAKKAITTLEFQASTTLENAISINKGTRVTNGTIYFETQEYTEIAAGETSVTVAAECVEAGEKGNNIQIGQLNTIVDPIPYIASAKNTTVTDGGCDTESDDAMKDRIFLSPSSYSTAGAKAAYEYWVRSYSPQIGDVKIPDTENATVDIRILMADGSLPSEAVILGLYDYLNDDRKRPLTDHILIQQPEKEEFSVNLTYYISKSDIAKAESIKSSVAQAVEEYKTWQSGKIGRDINPSELIYLVKKANAKRLVVSSPDYTVLDDITVASCTSCTVTYGGIEND